MIKVLVVDDDPDVRALLNVWLRGDEYRARATAEAKRVRKERIREQTKAVAAYVASNKEAQEFFEDWGTPTSIIEKP